MPYYLRHKPAHVDPREAVLADDLRNGLDKLELDLPSGAQRKLLQYIRLLHKWNRTYNLTAVRDMRQMVTRHILDSMTVYPFIKGQRVLDVGSGAGLPGIPLAFAFPDIHMVLLDSNGKKARFMRQAVMELNLGNAEVVQERAEDYQPDHKFDTLISRAFGSIASMSQLADALCEPGCRILAMKGAYPLAELEQIEAGMRESVRVEKLLVPGLDAERHLVLFDLPEA